MSGYSFHTIRLKNNLAKLPLKCVTVHPNTGKLIVLVRGESGYKEPTNGPPDDMPVAVVRSEVDRINSKAGITRAQEAAMLYGSMFGFHTKSADPDEYDMQGELKQ